LVELVKNFKVQPLDKQSEIVYNKDNVIEIHQGSTKMWRTRIGMGDNETGFTVKPVVGSYVHFDSWGHGESLSDCDDWGKAEFRVKTCGGDIAINVEVTGRCLREPPCWHSHHDWARVKITWVADKAVDWYTGEMVGEDVITRGWLLVESKEKFYS
jgi:hypothetical protein